MTAQEQKRVLITSNAFIEHTEYFEPLAEAGFEIGHTEEGPLSSERLLEVLPGHVATIAAVDDYNAEVLSAADDLRVISRWGVGLDSVDVQAATENDIIVTYTPGMVSSSVADMTFALILALGRDLINAAERGGRGEWVQKQAEDIFGTTLGIIGFGSIGQAVAYRARGFDMRVLAYDPFPDEVSAKALGVEWAEPDELLAESDYVSLHCALTDENEHMISARELELMKDSAYLINTARGGLIDSKALVAALQQGTIAGAALDVLPEEPPPDDEPLLEAPNCIVTPHNSFYNPTSVRQVNEQVVTNILDAFAGRVTDYIVNPEVMQA
ncbi:MAG: phosphoglycerate dehydrogenase [Armatimonadota bacterium]